MTRYSDQRLMRLAGLWLAVLILCALLTTGCNRGPAPTAEADAYEPRQQRFAVETVVIGKQHVTSEQAFTGDLLPRRMTRIVAEVEGIVQSIPQVGAKFDLTMDGKHYTEQLGIVYGQPVAKGDLLLQIDPRPFEIDLRMAQAQLAKAQADLAKLKSPDPPEEVRRLTAMRTEATARRLRAERDLERLAPLVASRAVTQAEYEQAQTDVATAIAIFDSTDASLAAATADPTAEEVAVQQALVDQASAEVERKRLELARTTVVAPYDGVVTSINAEVGERVAPGGDPLIELMDLRYLVAEFGVPEAYAGAVRVNDLATVTTAGAAESAPGVVVAINAMVDPAARTFRVRVAIDNASGRHKAGQFATVRLPLQSAGQAQGQAAVAAPTRALVFFEGLPHVFVLRGDRVEKRAVQLGLTSGGMVELLGGVEAGERVVVHDPSLLTDGMQVDVDPNGPAESVALEATQQQLGAH